MTNIDYNHRNVAIEYEGYQDINGERFSVNPSGGLIKVFAILAKRKDALDFEQEIASLDRLSLDEIRQKAKEFCEKYFILHSINEASIDKINAAVSKLTASSTADEVISAVNSTLIEKSPLDMDIHLVDGHSMVGQIVKPLAITPESITHPDRKMYFSHIELGEVLTSLSVGALIHEIAHLEQESNIGYAKNFVNREVISIFLEKVYALEADPSGELLKLSEKTRMIDILVKYTQLLGTSKVSQPQKDEALVYIKSTLAAEKLFDMYLNERKQKNKDKYFQDIQAVFDGQMTVEDLLTKRNITNANSQDLGMLQRHI